MTTNQARLELLIDVFDRSGQRAMAQPSLLPAELIAAVIEEFPEIEFLGNNPQHYQLYKTATRTPLDEQLPIEKQLAPGERLTFLERPNPVPPGTQRPSRPIYLRDLASNAVYKLQWLPAIIGRFDAARQDNQQIAVDLSEHSAGPRVSRRQAQIVEANGQLYVERLAQNPILVKNSQGTTTRLEHTRHPLHSGDTLILENSGITFKCIIREKNANP